MPEPLKGSGSWTLVQGEDFFGDNRLLANTVMDSARWSYTRACQRHSLCVWGEKGVRQGLIVVVFRG